MYFVDNFLPSPGIIGDMELLVLTFNLQNNRGFPKLLSLLDAYAPDVVALQEVVMSEDVLKALKKEGYDIAGYEKAFRRFSGTFSVATFYRIGSIKSVSQSTISLQRGIIEVIDRFIWGVGKRVVLVTTFKAGKETFNILNVHMYPYSATHVRSKQFEKALQQARNVQLPTVILGDFNYAYNRSSMETLMQKYDFQEATTHIFHTFFKNALKFLPIKFKLDYIFYRDITHVETKRVDTFMTDHTPLLAHFRL